MKLDTNLEYQSTIGIMGVLAPLYLKGEKMAKKSKKHKDFVLMMNRIIKWLYANGKIDRLVVSKQVIKDMCAPVVGGTSYNYIIPRFYFALEDGIVAIHHGKIVLTGDINNREKNESISRDYDNKAIRKKINDIKQSKKTYRIKLKKESNMFYSSREWRELRVKALVKYGRKCCLCGRGIEHGVILHVDHIKPKSKYPHLSLRLDNLQILCEDCNLGKSNKYEEQWRD